jgi:hypothetical protein
LAARRVALLAFAAALGAVGASPFAGARDWEGHRPCREHPKLSGPCFSVHGSMAYWNGNPSVRISKLGTKRVLGVSEGRFFVPGYVNLPEPIESRLGWDTSLVGDFLVCPFTDERPGAMRLVCVESGDHLQTQRRTGTGD